VGNAFVKACSSADLVPPQLPSERELHDAHASAEEVELFMSVYELLVPTPPPIDPALLRE